MIRGFLLENDEFLEEAIRIIYGYQTWSEKIREKTQFVNYIGFNKPDGSKLSHYADLISKGNHLQGRALSDTRERMVKYARQLTASEEIQSLFFQSQLRGEIVGETALALQIKVKHQAIWVPKSTIHSRYFPEKAGEQDFLVDQWVISKKLGAFITGRICKTTDLALQIQFTDKSVVWVPKSVIYSHYDVADPMDQQFLIANWFIQTKQLPIF